MPIGNHNASVVTTLTVDGQSLTPRTDTLTPENRINPKENIPYTDGNTPLVGGLPDVAFTVAHLVVLYLLSSLTDCTMRFTGGSGNVDIPLTAGKPYIWSSLSGATNPLTAAGTAITSATVINLGTAGGGANLVTTALTVDISLVNA